MENNINRFDSNKNSRIWTGLFLVGAGILLLAYKMGAPIPGWLFTWPVLLITIGLLIGIKSKFQNPGSFIMILVGSVFFVDQTVPGIDFHNYIVPVILIGLGILFIMRPKGSQCKRNRFGNRRWNQSHPGGSGVENPGNSEGFSMNDENASSENAEYIEVNAVFGGIKKNIQSKDFKGGEIVSFMGGAEINFMQADIQHPVVLEVNNVFGGTKLIIPSNWDVQNEISAVFGGVEDKRTISNSIPDTQKKIQLRGTCVFGGVEVTNY